MNLNRLINLDILCENDEASVTNAALGAAIRLLALRAEGEGFNRRVAASRSRALMDDPERLDASLALVRAAMVEAPCELTR